MDADAVQRLLDGQHVFVVRRPVDEVGHILKAFVRMVDHAVLFPDRLENILVTPEGVGLVDGADRFEAQIFIPGERGEFRKERQIDRPRNLEDVLVLQMEHLDEKILCLAVAFLKDLQPDGAAALALFDGFFHLHQKVLGVLVDFQVGVAGQPERQAGLDAVKPEQVVDFVHDDVLEQDKDLAGFARNFQKTREDGGHLHQRETGFVPVFQPHRKVQALVRKDGERAASVHGERSQHREQHPFEIVRNIFFLPVVHLFRRQKTDAVFFQGGKNRAVQPGILLFRKVPYFFRQLYEQLRRRQAGKVRRPVARMDLRLHPGDAHHKEFIQVRRGDPQEAQPFHNGIFLVQGFIQHTVVEVHPAQLPVVIGKIIFFVHCYFYLFYG